MPLYAYKNKKPGLDPTVYLAPTAHIIGDVCIGRQSSVWFLAVLRGDLARISIGERTNIQDLCVCHTDVNTPLTIGNAVTVGHRAVIHGCTIEDDCLIGMGAIVMNQAVIGRGSIISAGTVVLEKTRIPPYSLVTGTPGKIKKTYPDTDQIQKMQTMSESYMESAQIYGSDTLFYEIKP